MKNKKNIKSENTVNVLSAFIFLFIIVYAFIYSFKMNLFVIEKILISGNSFIDKNIINEIIQENIKNKNIYNIKINSLNNKLINHSFIQTSKIYTELPSTISILINEINPIILYEENSTYYLIDEKYNKIKADIDAINFFSVPILSEYDNIDKEYKQIVNSLKFTAKNNIQLYNDINEIKLKDEYMFMIISNNTIIKFQRDDIENNMLKLIEFISEISDYASISSYKYINLTIPNQIIVKDKKI